MADTGRTQINDIVLNVPPEQISIRRMSFNNQWQTLRTKGSIKAKSGFSKIQISFSVPFLSTNGGFEKLRDLVSQFRVTPFCYVENQFIRNTILAGDSNESMAMALQQLEITTVPGEPNTLNAAFNFVWFNYKPFTPNFSFKRDIFLPIEVRDPRESDAWRLMYKAEQRKWNSKLGLQAGSGNVPSTLGDSKIHFTTREYGIVTKEKFKQLKEEYAAALALYEMLAEKAEGGAHEGSADLQIYENLKSNLQNYNDTQIESLVEELFGTSTSMVDKSSAEDNLARLVSTLTRINEPDSYSKYSYLLAKEEWFVVGTKNGELIKKGDSPTELSRQIGNLEDKDKLIVFRDRHFDTKDKGIIVTGISLSFEQQLAALPVVGHTFPTYQHIGSSDIAVTVSMETTSEDGVRALSKMYDIVEKQSYKFKNIPQGHRNLIVEYNPLLQMFGLRDFIPDNMSVSSIPQSPGTHSAILAMVENPLNVETQEEISRGQSISSSKAINREISDILLKYLVLDERAIKDSIFGDVKVQPEREGEAYQADVDTGIAVVKQLHLRKVGAYKYNGEKSEGRDDVFENLCRTYGFELGKITAAILKKFQKYGTAAADRRLDFYSFYALNDNDVIAIERMQEDLAGLLGDNKIFQQDFNGSDSKGLAVLRGKSRDYFTGNETERSQLVQQVRAWQEVPEKSPDRSFWENLLLPDSGYRIGYKISEDQIARWPEEFRRKELLNWELFANDFISTKIIASKLIYKLPQFAPVVEKLKELESFSSSNTYPDFPLDEVVDIIQDSEEGYWEDVKSNIDLLLEQRNAKFKGLDASILIKPDFYFFNRRDIDSARLITNEIIKSSTDAIKVSHGQERLQAERGWFADSYNKRLSKRKLNNMRTEVQKEITNLENSDNKDIKEIGRKIKSQIGDLTSLANMWETDYLLPPGKGIKCSSAEWGENYKDDPIEWPAVGADAGKDTQATITYSRKATKQIPPTHASMVRHRFGLDAIEALGQVAYSPDPENFGEEGPIFKWPCEFGYDNCSSGYGWRDHPISGGTKFHKGIDIVGTKSKSIEGTLVSAAASGTIVYVGNAGGAGLMIKINHTGGWQTLYMHLKDDDIFRETALRYSQGIKEVVSEQPIASVGSTGNSTGPHLHFEIRKSGIAFPPRRGKRYHSLWGSSNPNTEAIASSSEEGVFEGDFYSATFVPTEIEPQNDSLISKSAEQFEKDIINGQGPSMMRAYPTFRLYFIESDLGERRRFGFDDFFAYSSVKEIQLIRSRKLPADLLMLQLTNISGALSNRKFMDDKTRDENGNVLNENTFDPGATNTIQENPVASMMLQPGIQIQLRLGYNPNPEELEKVFNGVITDVQFSETDDLVNVTCQSFAIELTQDLHGEGATFGGWLSGSGATPKILEELMSSPEVVHFGRWEGGSGLGDSIRGLLTDRFTVVPQPQDDNIFAPAGKGLIAGLFDSTKKYILYQSTIWDVFQEMCLRHPAYIAYPVPYEDKWSSRMTMFFGMPEQLYFARDPSFAEEATLADIEKVINNSKDTAEEEEELNRSVLSDSSASFSEPQTKKFYRSLTGKERKQYKDVASQLFEKARRNFVLDKGVIKPFRSYHLLTSAHHIIYNNISSSSHNTFNVATVQYSDSEPEVDKKAAKVNFDSPETFTLECDAGLPDEDKRELFAQYPNCVGYEMAKRYSLSLLHQTLKEGYKGDIIIIGNPKIKPYDICFIADEYTDMVGPIEVEQVVQKFTQQNGFVTEITPDMSIQINQHASMSTADAMGLIIETGLSKIGGESFGAGLTSTVSRIADWGGGSALVSALFNSGENTLGTGGNATILGAVGTFVFRKMITRTQLAHPFRYSPLVKNGKPMIGGFPNKITDGSFIQGIKTWFKDFNQNVPLLIDDYYNKIHPNRWIGQSQGSLSQYLFRDGE